MKTLKVKAKLDNLQDVLAFVDESLESYDCPMKVQFQIDVAVEELYVNVANYAYAPDTGDVEVNIWLDEGKREVAISFTDSGIPYNPVEKEDPDTSLSAEERQIGGLGIYMVKKSMDSLEYCREDGKNIVTIRKKI
jgi:anti-sigma regulatory factor (Ser/Thr protein kinase)